MAVYTQAQIDELRGAIAAGILTVESDGRRVTYRSLDHMRQILQMMEDDVNGTTTSKRTRSYMTFKRD